MEMPAINYTSPELVVADTHTTTRYSMHDDASAFLSQHRSYCMQEVSSLCSGPTHATSPPHLAKPMTPRTTSAYDMLMVDPELRSRLLCNTRHVQQDKSRHPLVQPILHTRRHAYQSPTPHRDSSCSTYPYGGYLCHRRYSIPVSFGNYP
jgi:hypothetical protein